jgi:hypothetical protein
MSLARTCALFISDNSSKKKTSMCTISSLFLMYPLQAKEQKTICIVEQGFCNFFVSLLRRT